MGYLGFGSSEFNCKASLIPSGQTLGMGIQDELTNWSNVQGFWYPHESNPCKTHPLCSFQEPGPSHHLATVSSPSSNTKFMTSKVCAQQMSQVGEYSHLFQY